MSATATIAPAERLADELRRRIAAFGPITVAEYMATVLTHPRYGYYVAREPFGNAGDFVTAPGVSQMFGELLGAWTAQTWATMGRPAPVRIVELGPGRGTMMADALRAARLQPGLAAAATVHLMEVSPRLREIQRRALDGAGFALAWHESLAEVPAGAAVILANEFFDALPVRQFQRTVRGWCERRIDTGPAGGFRYVLSPTPSPEAAVLAPEARGAPIGAVAEASPRAVSLAADLGARIAREGGAALIVDYGTARSRAGATLQAVSRHRPHPPLEAPGTADLSACVDFAVLARAGAEAGARTWGPVPQGTFLESLGIRARAAALAAANGGAHGTAVRQALERLVGPRGMGGLFQVLCLAHPDLPAPAGFGR